MSRYGANWQNANNPNMAPLPPRPPRGGIGSGGYGPGPAGSAMSPSLGMSQGSSASPMGTPGQPPSSIGGTPSSGLAPEAATTLFVGSISPGITDIWLVRLLEACGSLRNLKRVSKAFGFAEYSEPDAVLRAINVLNGRELPAMGPDAKSAQPKKLVVKADEKTKKFLEQYEQTRIATDSDEKDEVDAGSAVEKLIKQMATEAAAGGDNTESRPAYEVPAHLKDLPPEELPEEHRGSVLSEIEQFRQAAAAREEATRRREVELEQQRAAERARRAGQQQQQQQQQGHQPGHANGRSQDPQSYQRPVGFVPASHDQRPESDLEPEELDELQERKRRERKLADERASAAEAERMYAVKERQRLAHWEKELGRDKVEKERAEREAVALLRKWEDWRDDVAREKELFHTDRKRWRHARQPFRQREEEADERDRRAEAEEQERARQETERFLAQQAADMAALAEQQRAAGILVPQEGGLHAPLKLNLTNAAKAEGASEGAAAGAAAAPVVAATALLGEADDDDTGKRASRLKRIELRDNLTEEQKQAQIAKIEEGVPGDAASLFKLQPKWEYIDEATIQGKYKAWADAQIEESLGEKVEELVDFIVETLRAHSTAEDFVGGIEPVLAEEAEPLVGRLWKMLVVDSLAAAAGLVG
ncbi:uncharacterized protein PFL1_06589 [Pseudozyma flocculosa PF-1]|uniref:Related to SNU71 - component of U1 snRNP required for mRNA splicing via spliceosome n=2 Tax=Pseudozyma flocculosa TaxID=84751 RepID=A0A5C3F803_9BASI|nr:uncharacterized protein PFL1_06589 [Pseudozyma flocculosa PF-1]EPQ25915.1 hypothetical protein PFL1_06589 [Pseudozyma flocculosa PF-1]SPO40583.1 related to SNU71 - component of U1 snRNP required for mRNA splicing via spliceosome [Pseudozyma flocculosa]